jgi:hypothetical protein
LRIETGSLRITRCIRSQCCSELTWNVTGKSTGRRPSCEEFLFRENSKLLKLFRLVPLGLNLSGGSDTHQKKILGGIRPSRTRSCRVPDPAELSLAGYTVRPRRTKAELCTFIADACSGGPPHLANSCWVSDPAELSPAGYQTPGNNF